MKNFFSTFCVSVFCVCAFSQPTNLQTEHLTNPIGIDCPNPRLSWQANVNQTSYNILVSTDFAELKKNNAKNIKVLSDKTLIEYNDEKLQPFTKYFWKVSTCNEQGKWSKFSEIASFETGMMSQQNWQGTWLTDENAKEYKPAPYFRKEIAVAPKKIKSARMYIAAAGLFELSINGQHIGNEMLNPIYTNFEKRNLYLTYDIAPYLQNGKNAFGVLLGNGWYNHQSTAVWFFDRASWRNRPRFIANIRIEHENGTVETFATDNTWKTHDSPLIFNSIYTSEHYDFRNEILGWNTPNFDDKTWKNAIAISAPSAKIVSQQLVPIRITDTLKANKMLKISETHYIFHFPRNIAGTTKITVKGATGTKLEIKHSELLHENGLLNMANIDCHYRPTDDTDPFATDIIFLNGNEDVFSPRFNYKGFQYVEVKSSAPVKLKENSLIALEMHSDVPKVGSINSSNTTINKMWKTSNSSYLANLFGYPTDCPQREKNGWTGDAHINIETALYNFDGITVYEKWLADFIDAQRDNGVLPCIIPTSVWGFDWANGVDWTSAIAIIPYEIYRFYGDSRLLETMYPNIVRYVNYITSIAPEGLTDWGLGDWIPVKTRSNLTLTTSLYYYNDAVILAKAARLFGKNADVQKYEHLAEKIKNAINAKFLNIETGIYADGTQTELSAALFWGVVPENLKAKVAENLYKKVAQNDFHLDVGLLGTKTLLNALSENGYADAAYKIAAQETFPSWGYWVANGATTFYENWRIDVVQDASLNHIMFGEVNAWLYKGLGGIFPDENAAGFKHFFLKPNFVTDLQHFEAKHLSPHGQIISKWERNNGKIIYRATVPPNATATLELSDNKRIELKSGEHKFQLTIKN